MPWAGVVQTVWLQTGWLGLDLWQGKGFFLQPSVQTNSEAYLASYPMGTGGRFPGVKRSQGVALTTHPHLEWVGAIPLLALSAYMVNRRAALLYMACYGH
jgi:hypothetical protein